MSEREGRAPLRVLVLTNMWPTAERPAYGVFVAAQVRSLRDAGIDVAVRFVDGRTNRLAYLRGALEMLGLAFARHRYDLVHAHTGHCGALAVLQRRYPTLVSYVGYDLNGKRDENGRTTRKSRVEASVFRRLGYVTAATITKSERLERLLPRRLRARNTVLPNGVDRVLFRPETRAAARERLAWPDDERTVLFFGDPAVAVKRFRLAEEACALMAERLPAVRLRVCRDVRHQEVPTWMNAADALILTSLAEGSPNVVKEAAACNLPVVAAAVGDVEQVLDGVVPSAVVPVEADAAAYADALADILARPQRSNGRERTEWLADDVIASRLVDLYRKVADEAPRRTRAYAPAPEPS